MKNSSQRRALIVILNWNGKALIPACLTSLKPELSQRDDVLVVDNGSTDGSVALVTKQFPWAKQLNLPQNTGFTGGNNAAQAYLDGYEYFVLLNNDTQVEAGFLDALLAPFTESKVGITNAVILNESGTAVDHAGGKWLLFLSGTNVGAYRGADPTTLPTQVFETDYASGAALAMPTKLIRRYGLFADFFAYYEDVDLSWRIHRAGFRIMVTPAARVRHVGSASSKRNRPFFERLAARNRIWLFRRNLPWWRQAFILPILTVARLLLTLPSIGNQAIFQAQLSGLWAGLTEQVPA